MKKFILALLFFLSLSDVFANHLKGGWMYYEYLGPGIVDPAKLRYRLVLKQYMVCNANPDQVGTVINFTIFNAANNSFVENAPAPKSLEENIQNHPNNPCILNEPVICYKVVTFETIRELTPLPAGYTISFQRCCRIGGISNLINSQSVGSTYMMQIPGTNLGVDAEKNNSAKFAQKDTVVVCGKSFFSFPFEATDEDGDVLSYSFCDAYDGGSVNDPVPTTASSPPYTPVPYQFPYSGSQPLGAGVTIDPNTGVISGIAPVAGVYVVTVCCSEYRNGIKINETRKELHISSNDCSPLVANLNPQYVTCDGLTLSISNNAVNDPNASYEWNFGDPQSGVNNTSTLANPTHTFTAPGDYTIKLKVSINGFCADSTTSLVKVYPGFFPDFTYPNFLCIGVPVTFTDGTTTNFGVVDSWKWDFGDPNTVQDISNLQNPVYTYTKAGQYNVQLIVTNSKGCIKTINKNVTVLDKPPLTVFPKDTAYCGKDTLQLTATGNGSFNWLPNIDIINDNTATPIVFPDVQRKYYVTLTNNGCTSTDSVTVTPKLDLTNSITASNTNICEEDTITLTGNSNYSGNITWQWSPANSVQNPTDKIAKAYPATATNYILTTTWGKHCEAVANQNINVKPLAVPNAGPDVHVCIGQSNVQLNATGGDSYQWFPATGLSNANIPNPIAAPNTTTDYIVSVGVAGCSKRRNDTVTVEVKPLPTLSLTNDTLICIVDDLQLTAMGSGNIVWSPNYNIDNINSFTPVVSPDMPTTYHAILTDAFGCYTEDDVFVDVKSGVTLDIISNDTTICQTDDMIINTVGDALHYKWTPAIGLSSDIVQSPIAKPFNTTLYKVTGNIGSCIKEDQILITVVPYPVANAGNDTTICFGKNAQLNASGGSNYVWTPSTYLSNPLINNPDVIKPGATMQYVVTVTDNLGCPKPVKDTVKVNVIKLKVNAGPADTAVVLGEPLQLNGTGGVNYEWTPALWLNNNLIANPIALPQADIEYKLLAKSAEGCEGTDNIRVKVYKVDPDMYVPNAFTPNKDGLNDVIRPILLGIKELKYFRVYNRWGQMVFSTSAREKGWDGNFGGRPQEAGTYVWMAEGVTYTGITKQKKGYVVLIR